MGRYCTYTHGSNSKGCCQSPEIVCQFTVSVLFCFEYDIDNIQKVNNPNSYTPGRDLLELTYHYRARNVASAEKLITELHTGTERYYLFANWLRQYCFSTCI
jgi:hypothetical protein